MTWKVFQQELNLTHKTLKLQNSHDAMTQIFLSLRRVRGEQSCSPEPGQVLVLLENTTNQQTNSKPTNKNDQTHRNRHTSLALQPHKQGRRGEIRCRGRWEERGIFSQLCWLCAYGRVNPQIKTNKQTKEMTSDCIQKAGTWKFAKTFTFIFWS